MLMQPPTVAKPEPRLPVTRSALRSLARETPPLVRYREQTLGRDVIRLRPGDVCVGSGSEILRTTLGSCIAVCIWAPSSGIGGMNHFVLPEAGAEADLSEARYGDVAMPQLLELLASRGASRRDLQVKLFGGATMLSESGRTGQENMRFVRQFITSHGLRILAEDMGGRYTRQVLFFPDSGLVRLRRSLVNRFDG